MHPLFSMALVPNANDWAWIPDVPKQDYTSSMYIGKLDTSSNFLAPNRTSEQSFVMLESNKSNSW